jgi:hypothetical protein
MFENPWVPDLTPYDNVFTPPLHPEGSGVCNTGCMHCSQCGLGPQTCLTYRYVTDRAVDDSGLLDSYVSTLSAGLCPRCASA